MGFIDIVKAFIPLIIIVALLYGVLVVVKKYGYRIKGKEFSPINIKVLSTKMLMPKRFISVVRIEDKLLILGVSEHSINLLKEMDDIENVPVSQGESKWPLQERITKSSETFLDILKKNFGMK